MYLGNCAQRLARIEEGLHGDNVIVCAWRACKEKPSAETGPDEVSHVEGGHGYGGRKGSPGEVSRVEGGPGDDGWKGI